MAHPEILSRAIGIEPLATPPTQIPGGSVCSIGGEAITEGYPCMDIAPAALNDYATMFNGNAHGWLSDSAARMLSNDWNLGSRIAFADAGGTHTPTHYHLLTSREQAAKQSRPCWSDIVRTIYPARIGQRCVIILTTDVKKRCWNRARSGRLGSHTPVMIHATDYNVSEVRYLDWPELLRTLDIVESIYSLGFSKSGIESSLLSEHNKALDVGIVKARRLDLMLARLRSTPEFLPALIIAQKALS